MFTEKTIGLPSQMISDQLEMRFGPEGLAGELFSLHHAFRISSGEQEQQERPFSLSRKVSERETSMPLSTNWFDSFSWIPQEEREKAAMEGMLEEIEAPAMQSREFLCLPSYQMNQERQVTSSSVDEKISCLTSFFSRLEKGKVVFPAMNSSLEERIQRLFFEWAHRLPKRVQNPSHPFQSLEEAVLSVSWKRLILAQTQLTQGLREEATRGLIRDIDIIETIGALCFPLIQTSGEKEASSLEHVDPQSDEEDPSSLERIAPTFPNPLAHLLVSTNENKKLFSGTPWEKIEPWNISGLSLRSFEES